MHFFMSNSCNLNFMSFYPIIQDIPYTMIFESVVIMWNRFLDPDWYFEQNNQSCFRNLLQLLTRGLQITVAQNAWVGIWPVLALKVLVWINIRNCVSWMHTILYKFTFTCIKYIKLCQFSINKCFGLHTCHYKEHTWYICNWIAVCCIRINYWIICFLSGMCLNIYM